MAEGRQRSTFVTVVAWSFIVMSAFGALMAVVQAAMVHALSRDPQFSSALAQLPDDMPALLALAVANLPLVAVAYLAVNVFTLVCSIGLLRRRNWARLCFVGLMVLAIVSQLGGLGMQLAVVSSLRNEIAMASGDGLDVGFFIFAIMAVSAVFAIAFAVLFGWIAMRLLSPRIAAEFTTAAER